LPIHKGVYHFEHPRQLSYFYHQYHRAMQGKLHYGRNLGTISEPYEVLIYESEYGFRNPIL